MTKIQSSIPNVLYLFLFVKCAFCDDTKLKPNLLDIELIRNEISFIKHNFDSSEAVVQSLSQNWTENRDCFIELIAIENGIRNFDEWALKSMYTNWTIMSSNFLIDQFFFSSHLVIDSWGKIPVGLMSGNFFDLGAFAQCFQIKQNNRHYPTQYCIGQFKFPTNKTHRDSSFYPR